MEMSSSKTEAPHLGLVRVVRRRGKLGWLGIFFVVLAFVCFLFSANTLLAVDLYGFHAHYFVPAEPDKLHILRRLSVDPFLVLSTLFLFAYLSNRQSFRVQHHLPIHSNQKVMLLDGLLDPGRNRLHICFNW